ncbi:MAG TPA: cytochrome c biogenesis CcdA family protein [Ktedonobacteraceae bacterium]|nr:cytochrome c biogenesis CcdA family protein [Ktedonobacteraceae bacterium]
MISSNMTLGVAFLAGLASFLSPCVLPLVPIYLAQLVGQGVYQAAATVESTEVTMVSAASDAPSVAVGEFITRPARLNTFLHALLFVAGFTLAFVALGATASTLGAFLKIHQFLLREIGGVALVIIGLHLTGILKLPFLYWQKRFEFHPERPGFLASFVIGLIFAIGWTPCIGLILGPILALAANSETLREGVMLLLVYSLGLGIPFLLLGLGLDRLSRLLKWLKPHTGKIEVGTGVIMIVMGVMIYFNLLLYLNRFFNIGITV